MNRIAENKFGKTADPAVDQIITRILDQHFNPNRSPERKTIGEIQDDMLREINKRVQVVDFGNGENCEFKGTRR